nr:MULTISPECIES: glutaredoxin family protein [unclassified Marinobacterium]
MTTEGCHLCDQALPLLVSGIDPSKYEVDLVDIAFDDKLMNQYATRIPVLVDPQSKQSLDWPFDAEQLAQFIQSVEGQ